MTLLGPAAHHVKGTDLSVFFTYKERFLKKIVIVVRAWVTPKSKVPM
jgi:hypothetical protein